MAEVKAPQVSGSTKVSELREMVSNAHYSRTPWKWDGDQRNPYVLAERGDYTVTQMMGGARCQCGQTDGTRWNTSLIVNAYDLLNATITAIKLAEEYMEEALGEDDPTLPGARAELNEVREVIARATTPAWE